MVDRHSKFYYINKYGENLEFYKMAEPGERLNMHNCISNSELVCKVSGLSTSSLYRECFDPRFQTCVDNYQNFQRAKEAVLETQKTSPTVRTRPAL